MTLIDAVQNVSESITFLAVVIALKSFLGKG